METTAISSTPFGPAPRATTRGFNDLQSEDFFGLLIAELQNQDPLKPTDNQQMLSQMASIRQMEQSFTLNQALLSLAGEQRFGATAGLIGHYVKGNASNGTGSTATVEGVVTSVSYDAKGGAVLELHNGKKLPAESVDMVSLVENLSQEVRDRLGFGGSAAPSAGPGADDSASGGSQPEGSEPDASPGSGAGDTIGGAASEDAPSAPTAAAARLGAADKWARTAAGSTGSASWLLNRLFSPSLGVSI